MVDVDERYQGNYLSKLDSNSRTALGHFMCFKKYCHRSLFFINKVIQQMALVPKRCQVSAAPYCQIHEPLLKTDCFKTEFFQNKKLTSLFHRNGILQLDNHATFKQPFSSST